MDTISAKPVTGRNHRKPVRFQAKKKISNCARNPRRNGPLRRGDRGSRDVRRRLITSRGKTRSRLSHDYRNRAILAGTHVAKARRDFLSSQEAIKKLHPTEIRCEQHVFTERANPQPFHVLRCLCKCSLDFKVLHRRGAISWHKISLIVTYFPGYITAQRFVLLICPPSNFLLSPGSRQRLCSSTAWSPKRNISPVYPSNFSTTTLWFSRGENSNPSTVSVISSLSKLPMKFFFLTLQRHRNWTVDPLECNSFRLFVTELQP